MTLQLYTVLGLLKQQWWSWCSCKWSCCLQCDTLHCLVVMSDTYFLYAGGWLFAKEHLRSILTREACFFFSCYGSGLNFLLHLSHLHQSLSSHISCHLSIPEIVVNEGSIPLGIPLIKLTMTLCGERWVNLNALLRLLWNDPLAYKYAINSKYWIHIYYGMKFI